MFRVEERAALAVLVLFTLIAAVVFWQEVLSHRLWQQSDSVAVAGGEAPCLPRARYPGLPNNSTSASGAEEITIGATNAWRPEWSPAEKTWAPVVSDDLNIGGALGPLVLDPATGIAQTAETAADFAYRGPAPYTGIGVAGDSIYYSPEDGAARPRPGATFMPAWVPAHVPLVGAFEELEELGED